MAIAVWTSFQQIADSNGVPYDGAKVEVFQAGTATPVSVYSDSALSNAAANPIICDASGQHPMRYIATASYKTTVTDSADVPLTNWSKDNIDPGVAIGSGALPVANGGTGATTAPQARTNLGAAAASDVASIQSDISNLQTWSGYTLTTRTRLASGTTAQQPTAGVGGIRLDTDTDYLMYDNGSAWVKLLSGNVLTSELPTGSIVKSAYSEYLANSNITSQIPFDDTIPQIGEGGEIISVSFTPTNSSNLLRVRFQGMVGASAVVTITGALFKNTDADAVAAAATYNHNNTVSVPLGFEAQFVAGTTSATTFSVRVGPSASATIRMNGSDTARRFGGLARTTLVIEEIKV